MQTVTKRVLLAMYRLLQNVSWWLYSDCYKTCPVGYVQTVTKRVLVAICRLLQNSFGIHLSPVLNDSSPLSTEAIRIHVFW